MKIISFIVIIIFIALPAHVKAQDQQNIYSIQIDLWKNELIVMKNNHKFGTFPIAPGRDNSPTPIGTYKVVEKSKSWGGGFGTRWLGLNVPWGKYGMHGTNKPKLIGKKVSGGCIRMRNQDVESLYEIIPEGTVVRIGGPVTGFGQGELKNISLGSKGNLVLIVQSRLKAMGIYNGSINGIYDIHTKMAVEKLQKAYSLPLTGGISIREYRILGLLE
ncbi:L,D-transpeptidase family protein [Peribacillus sp. SCS-155]|uniref:L,D-transpeptidase family protein n=1 Tax=Peribacillus sedimenti TaxID=3115297 RepID=UPI0039060927